MSVPVANGLKPYTTSPAARQIIHEISQPLTALGLVLHLIGQIRDQAERDSLLNSAQVECSRAVRGVQQLRAVLETEDAERFTGRTAALQVEQRPGADA